MEFSSHVWAPTPDPVELGSANIVRAVRLIQQPEFHSTLRTVAETRGDITEPHPLVVAVTDYEAGRATLDEVTHVLETVQTQLKSASERTKDTPEADAIRNLQRVVNPFITSIKMLKVADADATYRAAFCRSRFPSPSTNHMER